MVVVVVVVVMEATDGLVLLSEVRIEDGVLSAMRVTLEAIKARRGMCRRDVAGGWRTESPCDWMLCVMAPRTV